MYDPLHDSCPGPFRPYPDSYWHTHTQVTRPPASTKLPETADVVVIGAGYTGLNTALELAERYDQEVVVLDANRIGWGCSGRNAGFAMPGTGRLGYAAWEKRYNVEVARGIQQEYQMAFERLQRHLNHCPQQLQAQYGGYLKVAHQAKAITSLQRQYATLKRYEPHVQWLDQEAIQARMNSPQAYAALHYPQSFGLNPVLLSNSITQQNIAAGVQLLENHPVIHWESSANGWHKLQTPQGPIRTQRVILATNGYTPNHLHPSIHGRTLPVLSSVLVTRILTDRELKAIRLASTELVMDTRALKYYFRLLPDGRLLFGGRGAIHGKDADKPKYAQHLLAALANTFPALASLTQEPPEYFWSGWISVALDDYPRIYSPAPGIFTGMGFCGAGVTFTQLAGKRLAQLAMHEQMPDLPFYQSGLPKFPLPQMRRLGQRIYYEWMKHF